MGNWRTVNVTGTMSEQDAAALRQYLGYPDLSRYRPDLGMPRDPAMDHFGPLSFCREKPSLAGLGDWPAPVVNRAGNLAERGYSVEDVAETLPELLPLAGSMLLTVHCGGDCESLDCIATIRVGEGLVAVGKPEVAQIEAMSDEQAELNVLRALSIF
jgi:hypothetical protein